MSIRLILIWKLSISFAKLRTLPKDRLTEKLLDYSINHSFAKPFGTHTLHQERGDRPDPPATSETVVPMNVKFCGVLETFLNVLEMLELFT